MYPSERHQRMILMAALQANSTKAVETLISLDEELKPHYATLKRAIQSSNDDMKEAANLVISGIQPAVAGRVHLDLLLSADPLAYDGYNDSVDVLIDLAARDKAVRDLILPEIVKRPDLAPILAYALLRGGERDNWDRLIDDAIDEPSRFKEFVEVLCCQMIEALSMPRIVDLVIAYLDQIKDVDPFDAGAAFIAVNDNAYDVEILDDEQRPRLIKLAEAYFLNQEIYSSTRILAFATLQKLDEDKTLDVAAELLARGAADDFLKGELDSFLYGSNEDHPGLVNRRPGLDLPASDAGPKAWQEWQAKR